MPPFTPRTLTLTGRVAVSGGLDEIFPLFSPLGERLWVPGWDPELLHPAGAEWEEGMIFRTEEERGPAVWVVSRLQREAHRVRYHRVEPGRYVACIEVVCRAAGAGMTEATIAYTFVGLSDAGNRDIAAMSETEYVEKMARWERWIRERRPA
jgi:hypothetical protein